MYIAEALHVSPAVLYARPTAVTPTREADSDGASEQDCEALLYAYRCVRDPMQRQALLALVQDAAGQD